MRNNIHAPTTDQIKIDLSSTAKRILHFRKKDRTGMLEASRREEQLFLRWIGDLKLRGITDAQLLAIPFVSDVFDALRKDRE